MKKALRRIFLAMTVCATVLALFTGCGHEHDFGNWKTEKKATCEKEGRKVRECDCGEEETKSIPQLEHEYESSVTKEATCQQEGVTEFTCVNCDDSYTEPISKLEHEYESKVSTEANCQKEVEEVFTCKNCDDTYIETVPSESYSSTEIYEMYLNSVGEIVTYDKSGYEYALGSCFVYSEDGKLITNYHVIEDAYSAEVTLGEKTYQVKKVLAYDKDIDVAVLKISASGLEPVKLCELDHAVGEVVYAFGNSRGLTSTFSDGMITYSNRELDGIHYVQHDAPISGGNSGGPLINIYGEVIGINTWTVQDSQNLNFAIHITELENLDYGDPMTMEELYKAEGNAYERVKNYITEDGNYSDSSYYLALDEFYSSDNSSYYQIFATYYPSDGEVWICMTLDGEYYVYFILDETASGVYTWGYFDNFDYYIHGTLYASTFDENTLLGYYDHNVYDTDLMESVRNLASIMMSGLCSSLTDVFAEIGVTAEDMQFVYY